MEYDGGGQIDCGESMGKNSCESVGFFTDMKRSSAAESLVEDCPADAGASAERHVTSDSHAAEGRYLKPLPVLITELAGIFLKLVVVGFRGDDLSRGRGDFGVFEGFHQDAKPARRRDCVVVEEGDDIGIALGEAAVACPAQSGSGLNNTPGRKLLGNTLRLFVSGGIIDNKDVISLWVQLGDGGQAFLQKRRPISCTDYNSGRQILFLTK